MKFLKVMPLTCINPMSPGDSFMVQKMAITSLILLWIHDFFFWRVGGLRMTRTHSEWVLRITEVATCAASRVVYT